MRVPKQTQDLNRSKTLESPQPIERRDKPRIDHPFFTRVRGVDIHGEVFDLHTITDNLSVSGLYMRMPREIKEGGKLFIVIHLSADRKIESGHCGSIAMRGIVVRTNPCLDSLFGMGVNFTRYRFI
jgi:PilZ domain-containing protein